MEQLLLDAKRLANRLRDHDTAADSLIAETNSLNLKLEAMKQVKSSCCKKKNSICFLSEYKEEQFRAFLSNEL